MVVFDMLFNVLLGVFGGIISGVIVSRVFLILGNNQKTLETLEGCIHRMYFIHGELISLKKLSEIIHDDDIEARSGKKPYEDGKEEDIVASQKMMDDLQRKFLSVPKEGIAKTDIEQKLLFISNQEAEPVRTSCLAYIRRVKAMKNCTFTAFNELDKLFNEANEQFDTYILSNKKRLVKQIVTDPTMIVLFVVVILFFGATVATGILGV